MTPELANAMARTQKLFHERDKAEDWGRNIIEGSAGRKTEKDWTLYYSFLTNPVAFNENVCTQTINPTEIIKPLPEELVSTETRNGSETLIIVKRRKNAEVDDEKEEKIDLAQKLTLGC